MGGVDTVADVKLHIGSRFGTTRADEGLLDHPINPHEPTLQGETWPPADQPNIFEEFASIPHDLSEMHRELKNLVTQLAVTLVPRPFANLATLSNSAGTQLGSTSTAWAPAFSGYTDNGEAELVDITIGTDAAQTVQLVAINARALDATIPQRLLGTIRTTANQLTQTISTPVILHQNEHLMLLCTSASSVHFDFSCRYRYLRS